MRGLLARSVAWAAVLVGTGTTCGMEPTAVEWTSSVGRVSAGTYYTCAVRPGGAAYCWGYGYEGQLGSGSTANSSVPVAVSGGLTFSSVTTAVASRGGDTSCGVTTSGAAYCWGLILDYTASRPMAVSGGLNFNAVSVGYDHVCGVTTSGAAYCWGGSPYMQHSLLGDSSITSSSTPVAVSGGLTFVSASAANDHTCGLTTNGAAYCWGGNDYGQLGNGSTTASSTPVAVSGGLTFRVVSAGQSHTCGVTAAGAAYCWGGNDYGQLGIGSTTGPEQCRVPQPVAAPCSTTPVAVSGRLTFAGVSAGDEHNCGVTSHGAAYCWGLGVLGELGNGSTATISAPVAVSGGLAFAAVSAGEAHTCGVTTDGAFYCWGDNILGDLGNSSTVSSSTPVLVRF